MQKLHEFVTWLKGLFIHPKEETTSMTDTVVEVPVVNAVTENAADANTPAIVQHAAAASPAVEAKAGVQDFEAALSFVERGVAQLGAAAKDELKALAKMYL